ncbi:glycosyltransferase [Brevundimonas sp.]|uniref:glycosyltransferase n=1 Tax=Brevundimonas sp. TaxID=1871086 RepID=UPI0035B31986
MSAIIGYYAHHQGEGHRQRAVSLARQAPERFVLLGTGLNQRHADPTLRAIDLPDDRPDGVSEFAAGRPAAGTAALHYDPQRLQGVRDRVALITAFIARERPALMVVDVSVEIAMLSRLASTPTVYVRLSGSRRDPAHMEAFRAAGALISPFAEALEAEDTPDWIRAKTHYLAPRATTGLAPGHGVLVVRGAGGSPLPLSTVAAAATAAPKIRWTVAGPVTRDADPPDNVELLGWVEDVERRIAEAEIVVGGAGDGLVERVLAAGKPFVCIPEDRPHGEQVAKGAALARAGAAVVLKTWPDPEAWPEILEEARSTRPRATLCGGGPEAAARWLLDLADEGPVRS